MFSFSVLVRIRIRITCADRANAAALRAKGGDKRAPLDVAKLRRNPLLLAPLW